MNNLQKKNILSPDEVRTFPNGKVEILTVGEHSVGRATFEPGWRWSTSVKPIVKTESCEIKHCSYVLSGHLKVVMNDGAEVELGPGDFAVVEPGHDAWVEGNEPVVALDFSSAAKTYAQPK